MPVEIPAKKTPASKEQVIEALWKAWMGYFGSVPKKESIWVILGHIVLETGLKYCHNYNLGNVKSRDGDGYDFQFFGCGEEIPLTMANAWKAKHPDLVTIKRVYEVEGKQMASVWVDPPHFASRFRAFDDILEGATDHIAILVKRFTLAWPYVVDGDPTGFSHALKQQGYYTADEAQYTKTLVGTYTSISKLAFDYDSLPFLTETEKDRIGNLVSLTLFESIGESLDEDSHPIPDDVA
jgi:hypothetical protein